MTVARQTSIAIVGGGIGGLAAGALLLRAGFDLQVYEQAKTLSEVGAGINIGPNASRILHRVGLADELGRTSVKPNSLDQRRWDDGHILLRSPLGEALETAFGAPYYSFHRGDLHHALTNAIPADRIHLAHRFTHLVDRGDCVEAHFDNGASISVDVLIGADGIHSVVRHALFGPEKLRFTGCVAYRGLVPANRLRHLDLEFSNQIWMGPGAHFVHYFVSAGRLINFVAVTEQDSWLGESWVDRGEVADVLAAFQGWHDQVLSIIGSTDETFKWALFDRSPLQRWSAGRVTLLGDACRPMLPFMGQGAAQAIEDGATLKACLLKFWNDVPAALQLYEQLRLPRASRLQGMSATNKTRFHMPDGPAQRERDAESARRNGLVASRDRMALCTRRRTDRGPMIYGADIQPSGIGPHSFSPVWCATCTRLSASGKERIGSMLTKLRSELRVPASHRSLPHYIACPSPEVRRKLPDMSAAAAGSLWLGSVQK